MLKKYKIRIKYWLSNKNFKPMHLVILFCALVVFTSGFSFLITNLSINGSPYYIISLNTLDIPSSLPFKTSTYRGKIKTVTFHNTINVPSDAVISWDVSYNGDSSVMAYLMTNSDDSTKYDLYIEANGKTVAYKNSSSLFQYCTSLTEINNLEYFDTSKVTTMRNMFTSCTSITSLDLSTFDTRNLTDMSCMFYNCKNLETINFGNINTSNVIYMHWLFYECNSLSSVNLSGFNTSNVTTMNNMFMNCFALDNIDVSSFDTSQVTEFYSMFDDCRALSSIDVSGFDFSSTTSLSGMFDNCRSLISLDLSDWDVSNISNVGGLFDGCSSLTSINMSGWDTSSFNSLSSTFNKCSSLTSLDLSGWDTSNITSLYMTFNECRSLTNLKISSFDTSKVTNMSSTFSYCVLLTTLDLNHFNTSKVTNMGWMFQGCTGLTYLDLGSFDMSKVTSFSNPFQNVTSTIVIPSKSGDIDNTTTRLYGANTSVYADGTFTLHTHESSQVTKQASCQEDGIITYTCTKHTTTVPIPKLGHNFVDGICTRCGLTLPEDVIIETSHTNYGDNQSYVILGTWDFSGYSDYVDIEITYQTESVSYDWFSIYSGLDYDPSSTYAYYKNYLSTSGSIINASVSNTSIKFGGSTKTTNTFTNVNIPKGTVILKSDSSDSSYYGVYVKISAHLN